MICSQCKASFTKIDPRKMRTCLYCDSDVVCMPSDGIGFYDVDPFEIDIENKIRTMVSNIKYDIVTTLTSIQRRVLLLDILQHLLHEGISEYLLCGYNHYIRHRESKKPTVCVYEYDLKFISNDLFEKEWGINYRRDRVYNSIFCCGKHPVIEKQSFTYPEVKIIDMEEPTLISKSKLFPTDTKPGRLFLEKACDGFIPALHRWLKEAESVVAEPLEMSVGKGYIRLIQGNSSAYGFVDHDGNLYKPASWGNPAKGVRGSIFNTDRPADGADKYSIKYIR